MYQGELNSGFGARQAAAVLSRFPRPHDPRAAGIAPSPRKPRPAASHRAEHNVAPPEKVSGAVLGGLVPYFVIMLA